MTSLLAFAWRRRLSSSDTSTNEPREQPEPASPLPPVVTASQSGDTYCDLEDYQQYIKISRHHTPKTPDGLRPRQPVSFLRRDLGIPQQLDAPKQHPSSETGVLPPRPSSIWSTQGVFSSPPVSTSSFYSRGDGNSGVAESPHLLPGQARTAVGAIVAMKQPDLSSRHAASRHIVDNDESMDSLGPLPRRTDWHYDSPHRGMTMMSADDSINENYEPQYYALDNDPIRDSRTPLRMMHTAAPLIDSPFSASSSLKGSPSSRAGLYQRMVDRIAKTDMNTSFSSQVGLMNVHKAIQEGYDFAPLMLSDENRSSNGEVVLASNDHFANMSAMSQSAIDHEQESQVSRSASDNCVQQDKYLAEEECDYPQLDGALLKSKSVNQRRAKEDLVMIAANRLRDDLQLVKDVELLGSTAVGTGDWFVKTPLDQEGLLSGFSRDTRIRVIRRLSTILDEMTIAQPEEFFLSPSAIPQYSETHDDLQQALSFCRAIVQSALPDSEKQEIVQGSWKFQPDVRAALGVLPAESPVVVRGGDTSLFSLPSECEDTPMTSNVSLTTTITSAVSPNGGKFRRSTTNGLMVRRTIEVFATLMQKLTVFCTDLISNDENDKWTLSAQDSIRITESIKRTYLQLLAMEARDLHAFIDSFKFDSKPLEITPEEPSFALPPPPPAMLRTSGIPLQQDDSRRAENLFSPNTEDMRTHGHCDDDEDDEGYDDLRRQIGSSDYDDNAEEREGPPDDTCIHRELRE